MILDRNFNMNVGNIAQLSTSMATQRTGIEMGVAVAKLANNNMEAQGQAALQMIQSVPKPQGSLGNHIDIKV